MPFQTSGKITATGSSNAVSITFVKPDISFVVAFAGSTFTGVTVLVEGKAPDANWYPVAVKDLGTGTINKGGTAFSLTDGTAKALAGDCGYFTDVRAYCNTITGGTLNVEIYTDNYGLGAIVPSYLQNSVSSSLTTPVTITGTDANALDVGQNGSTNPTLEVDTSTASSATGLKLKSAAAAAGMALSVISSGTNENLTIDAKGTGTITVNGTATGAVKLGAATTVTSTSADSLAVGPAGTTNPAFQVDSSTASAATGVKVTAAAAAGGVAVAVISSGANENLTIDAKGTGTVKVNGTATGGITLNTAVTAASSVLSTSATGGVGYATGAGGAVTQTTLRTTGVTLNKITGQITLTSAAGSTTPTSFTLTNSTIAATDVVVVNQGSGTDLYEIFVTNVASGSCKITSFTTGGTTVEQPVFNFAVIKGAAS